jgi:hypothetical protein
LLKSSKISSDTPMIENLRKLHHELCALRKEIAAVKTERIAKNSTRSLAERIGSKWFAEFSEPLINLQGLSSDLIENYSQHFGRLIKVSARNNLKKSYTETVSAILKSFRDDLIIPLQIRPKGVQKVSLLSEVLDGLPSTTDNAYIGEAIDCARHEFYRASVVLGWCAAIDRIHRGVEKVGFQKFNVASATMASQSTGRFKRFKTVQSVSSLGDIREVFDTVVLWIVEGMGLIDSNQHTRLRSCFDMRCQCAHPGDAPVTKYNLLSYFSDLTEIVFKNEKFKID